MSVATTSFLAGLLAACTTYACTPLAIRVAHRLSFFDSPVGYKGHQRPTPYLGGSAVLLGFSAGALALSPDPAKTGVVLACATVLWAVGTVDDRRNVSPALRVAVEAVLATGLWALNLGWNLGLGSGVDLVCTVVWMIAVINAVNLFDNMDGAAGTIAAVVGLTIAGFGAVTGDPWLAASGGALAGSCLGFLPYNLASPSKIFLGDGGSMPLGFLVGSLVMTGVADSVPAWQSLSVGLLLVGLPAIDTCMVVISRGRRGLSWLTGGRDHLTHRALRRFRSTRAVAIALGSIQAVISVLAVVATRNGPGTLVFIVLGFLALAGVAIVLLERQELETPARQGVAPVAQELSWGGAGPAVTGLLILGVGAAISPFFSGYYDSRVWVPLGLGIVLAATTAVVARPLRLNVAAGFTLAGLLGLGAWALTSALWAESAEQATVAGNRWLVLAAVFGLGLALARTPERGVVLAMACGAGILSVGGYIVVRMLSGDAQEMFLGGRLDQPLGYINGQGAILAMGVWIAIGLGETRRTWTAGAGAAAATLLACLAVLTQSRGTALALAAALLVVLAVLPGRLRRLGLVITVAVGVLVAGPSLVDVYSSRDLQVGGGVAREAAIAALVASAGVGLIWAAAVHTASLLGPRRHALRRSMAVVCAGLAVCGLVGASLSAGSIRDALHDQYQEFASPGAPSAVSTGSTRLGLGNENRYEYWRVAVRAWRDHPVAGVGAGNYDVTYYRERQIAEDIRQPHSVALQTLGELGLIGAGILMLFFTGLGLALTRARRAAPASELGHVLSVAGCGTVVVWLVQTNVDWLHLLPGVTAVALLLLAAVLRLPATDAEPRVPRRHVQVRLTPALLVGAVLVLGGASLSRQGLAEIYQRRAQEALAQNPAKALRESEKALELNDQSVPAYYIQAAAHARFNRAEAAETSLMTAIDREPSDFVTWTLLGDLAVRRGDASKARSYYGRAHRLNPQDAQLSRLAKEAGSTG